MQHLSTTSPGKSSPKGKRPSSFPAMDNRSLKKTTTMMTTIVMTYHSWRCTRSPRLPLCGIRSTSCRTPDVTRVFLLPTRARTSGALHRTPLGDKPSPPSLRGVGGVEKPRPLLLLCAVRACMLVSRFPSLPSRAMHARRSRASQLFRAIVRPRSGFLLMARAQVSSLMGIRPMFGQCETA